MNLPKRIKRKYIDLVIETFDFDNTSFTYGVADPIDMVNPFNQDERIKYDKPYITNMVVGLTNTININVLVKEINTVSIVINISVDGFDFFKEERVYINTRQNLEESISKVKHAIWGTLKEESENNDEFLNYLVVSYKEKKQQIGKSIFKHLKKLSDGK